MHGFEGFSYEINDSALFYRSKLEMTGVGEYTARVVSLPVKVAGNVANAAGSASTAVIVGSKNAVNGVVSGAANAGIKVLSGARKGVAGVTRAAAKLLKKTGSSLNGVLPRVGGGRNKTNKSNKNRKNKTNKRTRRMKGGACTHSWRLTGAKMSDNKWQCSKCSEYCTYDSKSDCPKSS